MDDLHVGKCEWVKCEVYHIHFGGGKERDNCRPLSSLEEELESLTVTGRGIGRNKCLNIP